MESDLQKADLEIEIAQLAMKAWEEGDLVTSRQTNDTHIETAKINRDRLKKRFAEAKSLVESGFISNDEYEQDRIQLIEAEAKVKSFELAKDVYERYTIKKERAEKESSVCLINEELLVDGDINSRSTRRIGFQVPPESSYTTGDHLCVHPLNRMEVVKRFAMCFLDEFKKLNSGKTFSDSDAPVQWQLQQPFDRRGLILPGVPALEIPDVADERVEAFATLVWSGVHEYTYVARATTLGRFVVPPAKAEEMYAPETFGRSASDKVIVE